MLPCFLVELNIFSYVDYLCSVKYSYFSSIFLLQFVLFAYRRYSGIYTLSVNSVPVYSLSFLFLHGLKFLISLRLNDLYFNVFCVLLKWSFLPLYPWEKDLITFALVFQLTRSHYVFVESKCNCFLIFTFVFFFCINLIKGSLFK